MKKILFVLTILGLTFSSYSKTQTMNINNNQSNKPINETTTQIHITTAGKIIIALTIIAICIIIIKILTIKNDKPKE